MLKVYASEQPTPCFKLRRFPTYPKRASNLVVRNDCGAKARLEGYLEERERNKYTKHTQWLPNSLLTFHKVARRINGPKTEVTGRLRKSMFFWVVMQFGKRPKFRKNILPPFSRSKSK